ncbi:dephospho-CoA kinase [Rubrobacter aplysinae]|uniref:dephospho-CoA kinase n=1 Tax=Rubrobacter aplysinae TaxID=909625 RepID=UPI00064BEBEE|nr:dephospho-CoA kinase [Rubrobacter aplysinae]
MSASNGGPVTVAVTGPLACGKSTFVRMLGELGAETVSADELVHDLLSGDRETVEAVAARFGDGVRGDAGESGGAGIDRPALSENVFGDPAALADLEGILHPRVRAETGRRAELSEAPVFVSEVPLLFEGGSTGAFDLTVAVKTPEERRRAWALERGMDESRREAIERRQLTSEEKAARADLTVENDGDLDTLWDEARRVMGRLAPEGRGDGPQSGEGEGYEE